MPDGDPDHLRRAIEAQLGEQRPLAIGATRLHLFDSQIGKRIADA